MSSENSPPTVTLQSALHAATRTCHTNLNKTITARLPLCLPPNAADPTAYYFGMLMFGHIYLTFEQAINEVMTETSENDETRDRHIRLLQTLSTERLPRTETLKRDYKTLSDRIRRRNPGIAIIEKRVQKQAAESTRHILENIHSKPHLALAYTWTMYLALFNGGRWLYKQLESPGPGFWQEPINTEQDEVVIQALSFWRFETSPQDPQAEQLKIEFKGKFEEASNMSTDEERDEVVGEVVGLFELCLNLIDGLDVIMADMSHAAQQGLALEKSGSGTEAGLMNTMWQTLSWNLLAPAYRMLNSGWARPIREEVKAVD